MNLRDSLSIEMVQEALDKVKANYETDKERLSIISPDRYEETFEIMANHFVPDEPLCQAFGITWLGDLKRMIQKNLKLNVSLCMISKDTNEIIGVQVNDRVKSSDGMFDPATLSDEPFRSLAEFLYHKEDELNFFRRYGVDEAMYFFTLCVSRKYRRQGVGSRLLAAAVAMSRELGFKVIKGEGTSNISQRIFEKQGLDTLLEMPYDSYMYKGRPISEGTGENTMTKVYGLRL